MWRRINRIFLSELIGNSDRISEYVTCTEALEVLKRTEKTAFLSYDFRGITRTIHMVDGEPQMVENKNVFPDFDVTKHEGDLFDWFETGLEGAVWALQEKDKQGYDGLKTVDCGDFLKIYNNNNELQWEGIIEPDTTKKTAGPVHTHWVQLGVDPLTWFKYFNDGHKGVVYKSSLTEEATKRWREEALKKQKELWDKLKDEG